MTTTGLIRECNRLCAFGLLRNVKYDKYGKRYQFFDELTCNYIYVNFMASDKLVFDLIYRTDSGFKSRNYRTIDFKNQKDFRIWLAERIKEYNR